MDEQKERCLSLPLLAEGPLYVPLRQDTASSPGLLINRIIPYVVPGTRTANGFWNAEELFLFNLQSFHLRLRCGSCGEKGLLGWGSWSSRRRETQGQAASVFRRILDVEDWIYVS